MLGNSSHFDLSIPVGSKVTAFGQPAAQIKTVHGISSHFDWIHFAPHCHGTHIEGPEHLDSTASSTLERVGRLPLAMHARVVSEGEDPGDAQALVVRTGWTGSGAWPVPSLDWLESLPCNRVILIDTPSLDPEWDGGQLVRHRLWFAKGGLVVEWCQIPADLPDVDYFLALNAAAFLSDAIPCRPIIYPK